MKIKKKSKIKKYPDGGRAPIKGTKEQYQAYQDSLQNSKLIDEFKLKSPATINLASSAQDYDNRYKSLFNEYYNKGMRPSKGLDIRYPTYHNKKFPDGLAQYVDYPTIYPVQPIIYQPEDNYTPIYTSNPNDPRLQAYQDSLTLYNTSQKNLNALNSSATRQDWLNYYRDYTNSPEGSNAVSAYNRLRAPVPQTINTVNGSVGLFKKPVQPIIYQPKPKEQPIKIQSSRPDLLQSNINLEFNPIGFQKGSYFTRPRQSQEQGSGSLTDYFDKKTGKLLGTYEDGGNIQTYAMGGINRYDVPAQMPTGQQFFQLPYNELATALLSKQKSYDDQEAEMAKNQAFLADLKSGYRTAGLPQEIQKEYNDKFQNYIGKDLTDPTIKKSLVQDIANLKGDSRLRTLAADIKQSALWDNYQQAHPDLAGAAVNPYNINGQWLPAKDAEGNWQSEDQVNNWYGNITPYSDPNKEIDDAFSKVKENTKIKIVESNPSATFHVDPVTGKEYYTTTTTSTDKKFINESLPQWQAAATEQAINFEKGATPGSNYFKARFAPEIQQDPDFIKKYISTAGGKYVYNRESENTKYDIHNTGSGSNGSGGDDGNVSSSMGTTTQILRQNTAIPKGELPTTTIKNYQLRTNQILETYNKQGYKTDTDEDGFKILAPKLGETIAETSAREAENTNLRLLQQKESNALAIHKALAIKYNIDPNLDIFGKDASDPKLLAKLTEISSQKEATFKAIEETYSKLPNAESNILKFKKLAEDDAVLSMQKILKNDDKYKYYIADLEALQNGVTESGVLTYPITGDKQKALRSSAQAALMNPVNYKLGEQGSIEYLQSNDNVSDNDKKEITKYLSKNKDSLDGISSVMWDREKGEYAVLVTIPKEDGVGSINVKISGDRNLPGLATAARQLDILYYDNDRSIARDKYQQYEEKTDGNNGLLIHPQLPKSIVTTHLPTTENLPGGKSIKQGETVFTLPELPNILLRMRSFDKMYDFLTFYNNPQNSNIVKDPQQLLKAVRDYSLEDIAVPDKIYNKYEQPIRQVKQESPKQ